jgi:hypothetical protein
MEMTMFTLFAVGIGILAVANGTSAPSSTPRLFLVLGESSLDIVDGRAEIGRIPIKRKWDPIKKRDVETVNDAEFVIDKAFWQMVDRNSSKYGARDEVRITNAHELLYHDKEVDIGAGVRYLDSALHWGDWVVGVGSVVKPLSREERQASIKGGPWYLIWFNTKTLAGSHNSSRALHKHCASTASSKSAFNPWPGGGRVAVEG